MQKLIEKVLLIAFAVGLIVTYLFSQTGLKGDAENLKDTTQSKLQDANTTLQTP